MGAPDRRAYRVEAAVVFPGGVPHERLAIELERGNSVAETLDGAGAAARMVSRSFLRYLRASGGNDAR